MAMTPESINRTAVGIYESLVGATDSVMTNIRTGNDQPDDSYFAMLSRGGAILGITIRGNGTDQGEALPLNPRELIDLLQLADVTLEVSDSDAQMVADRLGELIT